MYFIISCILNLVRECNGNQNIQNFPTFFVDTDFERKDQFTCQEIERLILWIHQLSPIDADMVKVDIDPVIKEIKEKEIRETKNVEGNIEHITREYFKRNKEIYYGGVISFSEWIKYKEEKFDNVIPKVVLKTDIDKKGEHNNTIEGKLELLDILNMKEPLILSIMEETNMENGEWSIKMKIDIEFRDHHLQEEDILVTFSKERIRDGYYNVGG